MRPLHTCKVVYCTFRPNIDGSGLLYGSPLARLFEGYFVSFLSACGTSLSLDYYIRQLLHTICRCSPLWITLRHSHKAIAEIQCSCTPRSCNTSTTASTTWTSSKPSCKNFSHSGHSPLPSLCMGYPVGPGTPPTADAVPLVPLHVRPNIHPHPVVSTDSPADRARRHIRALLAIHVAGCPDGR